VTPEVDERGGGIIPDERSLNPGTNESAISTYRVGFRKSKNPIA